MLVVVVADAKFSIAVVSPSVQLRMNSSQKTLNSFPNTTKKIVVPEMTHFAVVEESHGCELTAGNGHHFVAANAGSHSPGDTLSCRATRSALPGVVLSPREHLAVVGQS